MINVSMQDSDSPDSSLATVDILELLGSRATFAQLGAKMGGTIVTWLIVIATVPMYRLSCQQPIEAVDLPGTKC